MNHPQKTVISVLDEASDIYYRNIKDCSELARKQMSFHALDEIWKHMVIPAISEVRRLDRESR